jgi:hypothetical protein
MEALVGKLGTGTRAVKNGQEGDAAMWEVQMFYKIYVVESSWNQVGERSELFNNNRPFHIGQNRTVQVEVCAAYHILLMGLLRPLLVASRSSLSRPRTLLSSQH